MEKQKHWDSYKNVLYRSSEVILPDHTNLVDLAKMFLVKKLSKLGLSYNHHPSYSPDTIL